MCEGVGDVDAGGITADAYPFERHVLREIIVHLDCLSEEDDFPLEAVRQLGFSRDGHLLDDGPCQVCLEASD